MTPDQTELARRAVVCRRWRWMAGMLAWRTTHRGERVQVRIIDDMDRHAELADPRQAETTPSGSSLLASGHSVVDGWHRVEDLTPDLTDPATLGCLLALVREAWASPVAQVSPSLPDGHIWTCYINDEAEDRHFRERTEAAALVVALEAAP